MQVRGWQKGLHRPLEVGVVLVCGAVVVLGLSLRRPLAPAEAGVPAASGDAAMAALPSGAAPREAPPADTGSGCDFDDRGFGAFEAYRPLTPGKLLAHREAVDADGSYELVVHFHGVDAVRKLVAPEPIDVVVAGLDAGTLSSDYDKALDAGDGFAAWLDRIDREVGAMAGTTARARRVTLSSWSAGYGAVARALSAGPWGEGEGDRRFGGVILIDSLHASFAADGVTVEPRSIEAFVAAAKAAAEGRSLFFLTHSEVATDGYASTGAVADALLAAVDGRADTVAFGGDDVLTMKRTFDRGRLHIRGYAGADAPAHCAQLRVLPSILYEHVVGQPIPAPAERQ